MTLFRAVTGMAAFLPIDDTGLLQVLFIVFAAVAALLLIFVIVLFASKTVRKKLFRNDEKPSEEKPTEKGSTAEEKPQKQTARVRLAYSDSVPTVPLSAPTSNAHSTMSRPGSVKLNMTLGTPQKQPTYKNSFDRIPTVEIGHTDSRKVTDGNTYTAVPRTDAKTTGKPAQATKKTAGTTAKPVLKFTTATRPTAKTQTTTPKTVTKSPAPTAKPKTAATPAAKPATVKPAVKPASAKTTERNGRK